jgi:hypothetical protein
MSGNAPNQSRESFKLAVETVVERTSTDYQIRGSIAGGEFHLHKDISFSDVDLILLGVSEDIRYILAEDLHQALLSEFSIDLPFFIQPADNFFSLNQSDSRLMVLAEYLRKLHTKQPTGMFADFLLAKASLMVVNENPGQRYTQLRMRLTQTPRVLRLQLSLALKLCSRLKIVFHLSVRLNLAMK